MAAKKKDAFEEVWGSIAKQSGYTCVPDILIRHLNGLKITHPEFCVLYFLLTYAKMGKFQAHPSKETIADSLGVSKETVRRHITNLQAKGYIRREERRHKNNKSETNIYHFEGLYEAITKRAAADLVAKGDKERRDRRQSNELRTKRTDDLNFSDKDLAILGAESVKELKKRTNSVK